MPVRRSMPRERFRLGFGISVSSELRPVQPSPNMRPDVLNRYRDSNNLSHTIHIMKYIFPRQFGLHNAFTSTRNLRETTHPFKDYTLREQEISLKPGQTALNGGSGNNTVSQHLPKRLRGVVVSLVRKLQTRHSSCAYKELLDHYCPWNVRCLFEFVSSCH